MKPLKRIDISEDVNILANWLFDLPVLGYDATMEVVNKNNELEVAKRDVQLIEDAVIKEVSSEVDKKGKLVFSSQGQREVEMRLRLKDNAEYLNALDVMNNIKSNIDKLKAQSKYYDTMFSAVKNEIYHRRSVELLDSKKEMNKEEAKRFGKEVEG